MHGTNHFATLALLAELGIPAYGVVFDSGIDPGDTSGAWRNDTERTIIVTGLYAATPPATGFSGGDITIQAGDRQITGGAVATRTILLNNDDQDEPPMSWPGYGAILPPSEQITTTRSTATANETLTYTGVVVDVVGGWDVPPDFLEPRWLTITPQNKTGQQSPTITVPFDATVWDWMRANDSSSYDVGTLVRARVADKYITPNSIGARAIPVNAFKPSAQIMQKVQAGSTLWLYIDAASVAQSPAVVYRCAKPFASVG